jgi:hypothetical protein
VHRVTLLTSAGVLKTYRLTFESVAPMHALFAKDGAYNTWSISSKTLREFVEHFGPGTEQLDIYSEDGRVSLTSYTEKIMSGNGRTSHHSLGILLLRYGRNPEAAVAHHNCYRYPRIRRVFCRRKASHRHQRQGFQIYRSTCWHHQYDGQGFVFSPVESNATDV